ncbi:MAG: 2OG-Fe(II) oxygenase [Sphingobium sp.]|nr:2OG-Fe(II) oxygenase [Sphingobium sp.]
MALAQNGRIAEAHTLLEQAMAAGDALATATLAEWRLTGQMIRRDLALARDLYGRAAQLGLDEAEPVHIALLSNGAGGSGRHWRDALTLLSARAPRDPWARQQARLLGGMALLETGDPAEQPAREIVREVPRIGRFEAFLTDAECRYLVDLAQPRLQPSVVIHPHTGQAIRDPIRTAKAAAFPFVVEDPALHAINRRIAAATGTRYEQGEPLQVLRYDPGEEYKLHVDTLPSGENQRAMTFLVALNADYEGGETSFPHIDLHWRGAVGEALQFDNVDEQGRPEPRLRHAGRPVARGVKYLLSKWIRAQPLDLSGPPGRPF